jgi:hypothetical protein
MSLQEKKMSHTEGLEIIDNLLHAIRQVSARIESQSTF